VNFFNTGIINILSAVIRYRFSRYIFFSLIHGYIRLRIKHRDINTLTQYSPGQHWLVMLDAILRSTNSTINAGAVSGEVAALVTGLWMKVLLLSSARNKAAQEFKETNGTAPPAFLVISPGKSCNLTCSGCYANSDSREVKLRWDIFNQVIQDAKQHWGIKLVTFSGGEPLLYSSEGRNVLDIVEANPDLLFLMFTNGTLIDREIAGRLRKLGNLTPAISVEGLEKTTDRYRGKGIFKRVLDSMEYMRQAGVPFGISVTVGSNNIEEVGSNEFLDFFFLKQNVFYAFYFQYLPIGRTINLKNMPSPEQRIDFYNEIQEVIQSKRYFIIDFWNHGNLVNGCIAAGREDGYLYIDWEGKVMPCVFIPYSAGNIIDTYSAGGSLNDLWQSDFFREIRNWQRDYRDNQNNDIPLSLRWLMPCPFRDHHDRFGKWVQEFKPEPEDMEADKSISSDNYSHYMCDYGRRLEELIRSNADKTGK
jgi:MoaA/NifB/PqqE/SkfB family radical SAM enzyme